ncbi:MAG: leucine-rich repeat domain-containing protein, partial [Clostridia bacterium]|nr:leucine-rich repeat domain-containing protein [Clostridia bacterium]
GLESIGCRAFHRCYSLEKINTPCKLRHIGEEAFAFCIQLHRFDLPEGLETIEGGAFLTCRSLEDMTIPSTVTTIAPLIFMQCENLQWVTIPESVISIHPTAFRLCSNTVIYLPEGKTMSANDLCSVCFYDPIDQLENMAEIPYGWMAFNQELKSLTIPGNIKVIGDNAFISAWELKELTLCEGLEEIGIGAFENSIIEQLALPSTLKSVGRYAFGYTKLKDVFLNSNDTDFGYYSFSTDTHIECHGGRLPHDAIAHEYDDDYSDDYDEYENYDEYVEYEEGKKPDPLPEDAAEVPIRYYMFYPNDTVTLPKGIKVIGEEAFHEAGITEIELPYGCQRIEDAAFRCCNKMRKIIIPETVSFFGASAFAACTELQEITIPEGTEVIPYDCFISCTSLRKVIIPESVRSIEGLAFSSCRALEEIVILSPSIEITENAFDGCESLSDESIDKLRSLGAAVRRRKDMVVYSSDIGNDELHDDYWVLFDEAEDSE